MVSQTWQRSENPLYHLFFCPFTFRILVNYVQQFLISFFRPVRFLDFKRKVKRVASLTEIQESSLPFVLLPAVYCPNWCIPCQLCPAIFYIFFLRQSGFLTLKTRLSFSSHAWIFSKIFSKNLPLSGVWQSHQDSKLNHKISLLVKLKFCLNKKSTDMVAHL